MTKLSLQKIGCYHELHEWRADRELLDRAKSCVAAQQQTAAPALAATYEPDSTGGAPVSEGALREILDAGKEVHGIATERHITNAISFNSPRVRDSLMDRRVRMLRREVDRLVFRKISETIAERLVAANSGHYWYPPGGYMGWHTNSRFPGWRLYITFAEEPGRSFLRYRDPETREISTSIDEQWDFRLFRIRRDTLLWHAVYSDTNRFSLGYTLRPWTLRRGVTHRTKALLRAVGM